ncbi:hypothetical protein G6F68_017511 [Rhizopus microsporus]|nr:hypothetical protein G6F68_017511 [Rhizopus microsporus]
MPVEFVTRDHLHQDDAPVHYVENALINSLFGLLCWPAVFAPLPGAFFHPFQRAPADLDAPDFHQRRAALFNDSLCGKIGRAVAVRVLGRVVGHAVGASAGLPAGRASEAVFHPAAAGRQAQPLGLSGPDPFLAGRATLRTGRSQRAWRQAAG